MATEWKVPDAAGSRMPSDCKRCCISAAALRVNVSASTCRASQSPVADAERYPACEDTGLAGSSRREDAQGSALAHNRGPLRLGEPLEQGFGCSGGRHPIEETKRVRRLGGWAVPRRRCRWHLGGRHRGEGPTNPSQDARSNRGPGCALAGDPPEPPGRRSNRVPVDARSVHRGGAPSQESHRGLPCAAWEVPVAAVASDRASRLSST